MKTIPSEVWLLPGWQNSGPGHWQTLWQQRFAYFRLEQHDWMNPLRGDWQARLDDSLLERDAKGVILVAHSLGCQLVSFWAGHSQQTQRVKGALLVAPGDVEQANAPLALARWAPVRLQRLPFPSILVASRNDPFCTIDSARRMASAWGSEWIDLGERGHINADSELGDWPQGQALLQQLQNITT